MIFKDEHVSGRTIDSVWFDLLVSLVNKGRILRVTNGSCAGDVRLQFDFVSGTIYKPVEYVNGVRLPLSVTVPVGVSPPTDEHTIDMYFANYLMDSTLNYNNHYKYSTFIVGGEYHIPIESSYVKINVPNQLQWCIDHFKKKGFGNNHCRILVGYPESNHAYDIPYSNETERGTSPCLQYIGMKIVSEDGIDYLCFDVEFRSWDLYGAFPTNMGGLALLMEYTAMELGVEVGALSFTSSGLHVYGSTISEPLARSGNKEFINTFNERVKQIA